MGGTVIWIVNHRGQLLLHLSFGLGDERVVATGSERGRAYHVMVQFVTRCVDDQAL